MYTTPYINKVVNMFNDYIDNGHTRMDVVDLCKKLGYKDETIFLILSLIKKDHLA